MNKNNVFFTRWREYPEEKPTKTGKYNVVLKYTTGTSTQVEYFTSIFNVDIDKFSSFDPGNIFTVIAWCKLKPYER